MGWLWGILAAGVLAAAGAAAYHRVMNPKIMEVGSGPVRIACVGDSITYGLGVLGQRRRWSYPACLVQLLGEEYRAINYGLTDRSLLSDSDKPYFAEPMGKDAWNAEAEILLLMLGSNDSKLINWDAEKFYQEYLETLRHYQSRGIKALFVMLPPKIYTKHPGRTSCNEQVLAQEVRPLVSRAAAKCGVPCIDLYAVTQGHSAWFPDTIHPSKAGNLAIAAEIEKALRTSGVLAEPTAKNL